MNADAQTKLNKQLSSSLAPVKPILPKPSSGIGSGVVPNTSSPTAGYGPQGALVSVQQLIAAHRKENPNLPPIRLVHC